MGDRRRVAIAARPVELWPPDDTEESVMGTDLHQTTITNLRWGLNDLAAATPGDSVPWHALGQTLLTGLRRPDDSPYQVLPDIFVYLRSMDPRRPSLSLAGDGAPALIVEVLSPTTYRSDLDLAKGKGYSYARAGVREYMLIDPIGEYLEDYVQAWRLTGGVYAPWLPDESGRWWSEEIQAGIGLEGLQAAVYAPDGRRQLRQGEVTRELLRQEAQLARERSAHAEELARQDRQYTEELARRDRQHAEELEALRRRLDERSAGK